MRVVVYLGPTMPVAAAQEILPDAIYLPPAAQSDILSAVDQHRPDAIALIDGVFTQALSVWHKEILYALQRGVAVYGASSMGALRVAETATFGSIGVGGIFEAYSSGELTDDDEVAVMHATADFGFRSLSDAMVNIRATLAAARDAGVIDDDVHEQLIGLGKARFFPERTYSALWADAESAGLSSDTIAALREFVRGNAIDAKRDDAIALLTHLRDNGHTPPPEIEVTQSHPFATMYHRDRKVDRGGTQISLADIGSYAALHLSDFPEINEAALHGALVDVLAEMLDVEPTLEQVDAELARFRADRRLRTDAELEAWKADNDLNDPDFQQLITLAARRRILRDWFISRKYLERTTEEVLNELRLRGRYPATADAAAFQSQLLASAYPDFEYRGDDAELVDLIRDQASSAKWRPTVALDTWAFENGFKDVYDVRYELVRAKLARQATSAAFEAFTVSAEPSPHTADDD